jgi:hypothetical protein
MRHTQTPIRCSGRLASGWTTRGEGRLRNTWGTAGGAVTLAALEGHNPPQQRHDRDGDQCCEQANQQPLKSVQRVDASAERPGCAREPMHNEQ